MFNHFAEKHWTADVLFLLWPCWWHVQSSQTFSIITPDKSKLFLLTQTKRQCNELITAGKHTARISRSNLANQKKGETRQEALSFQIVIVPLFEETKDCHLHSAAVTCQTPPPRPPRWHRPCCEAETGDDAGCWCWWWWWGWRLLLSGSYCASVYFFYFGGVCWASPSNSAPPRRTLGHWRVDKSSCLSQPCALIRSSTSKDWIMACCPHAGRSLPCCRTAGDRQSALNLWISRTGEKKGVHAARQQDDVFTMTSGIHTAVYVRLWCFMYWWVLTHELHMCTSQESTIKRFIASTFKSTCIEAYFFFFWQERVNPLSLSFKRLANRIWWTKALWSRKQKCCERWWASFLLPGWRTHLWNSLSAPTRSPAVCLQIISGWQFYNSAGMMRLCCTI